MKQHISIECLDQLSEEQKNKLRELWEPKNGEKVYYEDEGEGFYVEYLGKEKVLPFLSIGQMIEILEKECEFVSTETYKNEKESESTVIFGDESRFYANELCDALWKAVLSIL